MLARSRLPEKQKAIYAGLLEGAFWSLVVHLVQIMFFCVTNDSLNYSNWDIDKCRVSIYTVQDSDI